MLWSLGTSRPSRTRAMIAESMKRMLTGTVTAKGTISSRAASASEADERRLSTIAVVNSRELHG